MGIWTGTSSINVGFSIVIVDYTSKVHIFVFFQWPPWPVKKRCVFFQRRNPITRIDRARQRVGLLFPFPISMNHIQKFRVSTHISFRWIQCFIYVSQLRLRAKSDRKHGSVSFNFYDHVAFLLVSSIYWFLEPCPFQDPLGRTGLCQISVQPEILSKLKCLGLPWGIVWVWVKITVSRCF